MSDVSDLIAAVEVARGRLLARVGALDPDVVHRLGETLLHTGLERVVLPHFVAGPLDARQRLEFLRWHLERHERQIERTLEALETT